MMECLLNSTALANIQPPNRPNIFSHPMEYLNSVTDLKKDLKTEL